MKNGDVVVFKNVTFEGRRICYEVLNDRVVKRKKHGYWYDMIRISMLGYAPIDLLMLLEDALLIDPKGTRYVPCDEVEQNLNTKGFYKSRED